MMHNNNPNNFRRKMKDLIKNAQRNSLNKDHRDIFVCRELLRLGLMICTTHSDSFSTLCSFIRNKTYYKVRGRNFLRLGKAAKKQKKYVFIGAVASFAVFKRDLREIKFCNEFVLLGGDANVTS